MKIRALDKKIFSRRFEAAASICNVFSTDEEAAALKRLGNIFLSSALDEHISDKVKSEP